MCIYFHLINKYPQALEELRLGTRPTNRARERTTRTAAAAKVKDHSRGAMTGNNDVIHNNNHTLQPSSNLLHLLLHQENDDDGQGEQS